MLGAARRRAGRVRPGLGAGGAGRGPARSRCPSRTGWCRGCRGGPLRWRRTSGGRGCGWPWSPRRSPTCPARGTTQRPRPRGW